jgi:hypothetical protein
MMLSALLLAYAGMVGLALAMGKHYRQVWPRDPAPGARRAFRVAGWLCLAGALMLCVRASGGSIGTVTWFGLLFVSALSLVFLLAYAARAAALLGLASLVVSLVTVLLQTAG